jgi:hypothetical protein
LDFSNPYSFLMQAQPPAGGGICWHFDSTFGDEAFLASDRMFGDANVVVVARCAEDAAAASALARIYEPSLKREFRVWKDTGALLILARNGPAPVAGADRMP